jgi:DNA-binding IclR family transcriptional regulator
MAPTIKSVAKAFDLPFLFDSDRTVLQAKAIAGMPGIPHRTPYRLVNTLCQRDVLTIETGTGQSRLSPRLGRLLAAMGDSADVLRLSHPFPVAPARTAGETPPLYLSRGDAVVPLEDVENQPEGQRIPLHCGAGARAAFAFHPRFRVHLSRRQS